MIRANLLVRRLVAAVPRGIAPRAAPLTASSAVDAMASSRGAARLHPIQTPPSPSRPFSSDAATELGSILQREIEEEEAAAAEFDGKLPPELAELDSEIRAKWTVVEGISGIGGGGETGSGATMRLFRKEAGSKGAKIGVVFHCQDTEDDVRFDEEEFFEGQNAEGEEGEDEHAQAVRFGVTVSKGGKTVVLQCRSDSEGDINVESVVVRDGDAEAVLSALAGGEGLHAALYQGPEFTELAEDLQESLRRYVVEECGVDGDVAAYMAMYSDYREQEEYLSWMRTAIDILD